MGPLDGEKGQSGFFSYAIVIEAAEAPRAKRERRRGRLKRASSYASMVPMSVPRPGSAVPLLLGYLVEHSSTMGMRTIDRLCVMMVLGTNMVNDD